MTLFKDPIRQNRVNLEKMEKRVVDAARKRLVATAADIRKGVQASLKSGGKNRYSKTFQTSKPGEPPKTHGNRLKRSIRYEIESPDKITVGAPSFAGSRTAATLEKGGKGKVTETTLDAASYERRAKRARSVAKEAKAARERGETPATKPTAKRPYRLRSESGKTRRVVNYERFTSAEAAKRAISAPGFKAWRDRIQQTKTTTLEVRARPFVAPAAKKVIEKRA